MCNVDRDNWNRMKREGMRWRGIVYVDRVISLGYMASAGMSIFLVLFCVVKMSEIVVRLSLNSKLCECIVYILVCMLSRNTELSNECSETKAGGDEV